MKEDKLLTFILLTFFNLNQLILCLVNNVKSVK